jgi:hypothetical protein
MLVYQRVREILQENSGNHGFVPEKDMFSCFYPMRRVTRPTPTFYLAWQLQLIVVPSVSGTTKPPKWVETTKQR